MRVWCLIVALSGVPVHAASEPSYAPAPEWVQSAQLSPATASVDNSPLVLLDSQVRFGTESSLFYTRIVGRHVAAQSARGEPIVLPFSPERQNLIIHNVAILRAGQTIDLLARGQRFFIIRREANLEAAALDGMLTAVLQPEGLQDGDLLDVAFTVVERAGELGRKPENLVIAPSGLAPDQYRIRATWPKNLDIKVRGIGMFKDVRARTLADMRELSVSLLAPRLSLPPKDAPSRTVFNNSLQTSGYADWADVGALLAPHFDQAATLAPDSPLHAEVVRIKAETADPAKRTMLALRLVQDQVRYVLMAMNGGDYIPASADRTWSRRFGDCKGKTALLMALLRAMDVPATAILVRSSGGEAIDQMLPSLGLFDHVIVRVETGGATYWLDGTRLGDRDITELKSFPFGVGVPIQPRDAAPATVPYLPPLSPVNDWTIHIDARGGLNLPSPTRIDYLFRGPAAAFMNATLASAPKEEADKYLKGLVGELVDDFEPASVAYKFDGDAATLRVSGEGKTTLDWRHPTRVVGKRLRLEQGTVKWNATLERTPEQAGLPVALGRDVYIRAIQEIRLPNDAKGFSFEGEELNLVAAGAEIRRGFSIDGDTARQTATFKLLRTEIPAAAAIADKPKITANNEKLAYLVAPADYEPSEGERAAVLKTEPADAESYSRRALAYMDAFRWANARTDLTKAIELDPDNAWHRGNRAIVHFWLGDLKKARADAEESLSLAANLPAHNALGLVRILDGDLDGAVASFTSAITVRPDNLFSLEKRTEVWMAKRDWTRAAADIDEIERLSSDKNRAIRLRSQLLFLKGDLPAAASTLDKLAMTTETETGIRVDRIRLLRAMGRAVEAETELAHARAGVEALLAKMPADDREPIRAVMLDELELHQQAVAVLDRLLARQEDRDLLNARCWSRATRGAEADLPKALRDCDQAIERVVGFTAAYDSRGLVKLKMGQFNGAIADFTTALGDMPALTTSLFGRGIARLRTGDKNGQKDLIAARALSPMIDERFAAWGVKPEAQ